MSVLVIELKQYFLLLLLTLHLYNKRARLPIQNNFHSNWKETERYWQLLGDFINSTNKKNKNQNKSYTNKPHNNSNNINSWSITEDEIVIELLKKYLESLLLIHQPQSEDREAIQKWEIARKFSSSIQNQTFVIIKLCKNSN